MIWEKIRSKIGQLILYFLVGSFVQPITINKEYNYLFTLKNDVEDGWVDDLHAALSKIVDGEILIIQGVELNIIGLADED